jgi:3-oxoacyl-[acyl-carrier-protein] synthase III
VSRNATVTGTGCAVPGKSLSNAYFDELLGQPVSAWLTKNTGIEHRFHLEDGQVTSDLAIAAARQALERASKTASDVDLIILATDTPDQLSPATAVVVQHALGATRAVAFDVNCACAGFVTALETATKFIQADARMRTVLVLGAYGMSRYLDWKDKTTCTLFADGAGAFVLEATETPNVGWLGSQLYTDGSYWDALGIYRGGTRLPSRPGDEPPVVKFVRKFPASYNVEHWPRLLRAVSTQTGIGLDQVKLFVFTQLNLRVIESVMAALEQPMSRAHWVMHKWGYTGSGCIPMTLHDAVDAGKLAPGDVVAFCASGGGVSMAASFFRWTAGGRS